MDAEGTLMKKETEQGESAGISIEAPLIPSPGRERARMRGITERFLEDSSSEHEEMFSGIASVS